MILINKFVFDNEYFNKRTNITDLADGDAKIGDLVTKVKETEDKKLILPIFWANYSIQDIESNREKVCKHISSGTWILMLPSINQNV